MTKKQKFAFVLSICTIVVVSVALVFRIILSIAGGEEAADAASSSSIISTESVTSSLVSNETVSSSSFESKLQSDEINPDIAFLFQNDAIVLDKNRLTVTFDGLTFCVGKSMREVVVASEWYSLRANDILQPDETGYLILNNDAWTSSEIQLNKDTSAKNGEVILWVHNYTNAPAKMADCTVYKFKINYADCFDVYTEKPTLSYLDKYYLGYKGTYDDFDHIERNSDDNGIYIRHIFGDIDGYQVIADSNDRNGLFAITVFCNEIYGPNFETKGGEINE